MSARRRLIADGAAWFAVAAPAVYTALRLLSWARGEPDPAQVLASAHVAWYWRVATATWLAGLLALLGARMGGGAHARRALPWVVAAAVLVAFLVP